jgi:hypothetical protein
VAIEELYEHQSADFIRPDGDPEFYSLYKCHTSWAGYARHACAIRRPPTYVSVNIHPVAEGEKHYQQFGAEKSYTTTRPCACCTEEVVD